MEHAMPTGGRSDREAIADFMIAHEAALRRRIGAAVRGSPGVDADDVFSTTLRRVDGAAARGTFRMRSAPEAWCFVAQVVQRAVERHRRRAARMAEAIARLAPGARAWDEPDAPADTPERAELVNVMRELERTRPEDAEMVRQRLRGKRWKEISAAMGVSEEALRQRWSTLMARLRERLAEDVRTRRS